MYISDILPPVWSIFTQSVEHYINTTVNCCDHPAEAVDEDGKIPLHFDNFTPRVFAVDMQESKFVTTH